MSERFNLVFIKIDDHQDPTTVRLKLAESLKTDEARVQAWIDAQGPVTLLRDVERESAEKVRNVVLRCGAICEIEEIVQTDESGLGLVPKKFGSSDHFVCPQCQIEKEIPTGSKVEVCDNCGLIVAKWEQKKRAEREKEKLRRQQLREARLKENSEEERQRKRDELERLEKEEAELRLALGIKGPSRLEKLFQEYPYITLSGFCVLAVIAAVLIFIGYQNSQDRLELEHLIAQEPSLEILKMAPAMASAVQMQQTGNKRLMTEIADVANVIRMGHKWDTQALEAAATDMMKGVGPEKFMEMLGDVNVESVTPSAKIAGLEGVDLFPPGQLPLVPGAKTGAEMLLDLFSSPDISRQDEANQQAVVITAVEHLDGSELIDMLKASVADPEWDEYLKKVSLQLIYKDSDDVAEEVALQIKSALLKVRVFTEILVKMSQMNRERDVRVYTARVELELSRIEDNEERLVQEIEFGRLMASLGNVKQPAKAFAKAEEIIEETGDLFEQALLQAQLAVALLGSGNELMSAALFRRSVNTAGRIESNTLRMRAFSRIAQRHYDVRNTTLANEIVNEIIVAISSLYAPAERALVFADLALTQAYLGDMRGAYLSVSNTGSGSAQTQVLELMAEFLIDQGLIYRAMEAIDSIDNPLSRGRLLARLARELIATDKQEQARKVLDRMEDETELMPIAEERALLISTMARLHARLGFPQVARQHFKQANAFQSEGRRGDLTRAMIAIDQVHSLMPDDGYETLGAVSSPAISEQVETAISAVRVLRMKLKETR
jgi:hypothetical protein